MRDGNCVAIGWDEVKIDLSDISYSKESKEKLRQIMFEHFNDKPPATIGKYTL